MIEMEEEEAPTGAPAWMATFADLMSLLMCFFVLLLSFSEMDVQKYKQVAGSMKDAFGVQNQVKVMDIPKGTSIIAQEFSPGKTQPTQIDTVNQFTVETLKKSLRVGNPNAPESDFAEEQANHFLEKKMKELMDRTKADADKLKKILHGEITDGKIDIETHNRSITIRIREKGSFTSASAKLNPDFIPTMAALRDALGDIEGSISVDGHTDNIPIASAQFISNWELSASRALSVTHELLRNDQLDSTRFMIVGHADTRPFKPNTSSQNRALNRRVEIFIRQGIENEYTAGIDQLQEKDVKESDNLEINNDVSSDNLDKPLL